MEFIITSVGALPTMTGVILKLIDLILESITYEASQNIYRHVGARWIRC